MRTKVTLLGIPGPGERGANLRHDADLRKYYALDPEKNQLTDYLLRASSQEPDFDGATMPAEPFGADGRLLSDAEMLSMRSDADEGRSAVWYGTVAVYGDDAPEMTRDRWRKTIAAVSGDFFDAVGLDRDNVDMICVAHTRYRDDPHVHISFWEKEPRRPAARGGKAYTPARDVWERKGELERLAGAYLSDGRNFASWSVDDMLRSAAAAARSAEPGGEEDVFRALSEAGRAHLGERRDEMRLSGEETKRIASALYLTDERVREAEDGFRFGLAAAERDAAARYDRAGLEDLGLIRKRFEAGTAELFRDAVFVFAATDHMEAATDARGETVETNDRFRARWRRGREGKKERRKVCAELVESYPGDLAGMAEEASGLVRGEDERSRERAEEWAEERLELSRSAAGDRGNAPRGREKDSGGRCR